jgi:Nucleoside 2-deoxyribosyltransferase
MQTSFTEPSRSSQQPSKRRDVGRGQLPRRLRKPTIYFAGRMRGGNWRDGVGLRRLSMVYYDSNARSDPSSRADCGSFWYGGPFVYSGEDFEHVPGHVCYCHGEYFTAHQEIWDIDRLLIEKADIVLAYLDDGQAYGTLVEIGYAAAKDTPVCIGFSDDNRSYEELWLCRMPAAKVYFGSPDAVWREFSHDWIA